MNRVLKLMAGVALLLAANVLLADEPSGATPAVSLNCDVQHPTEARATADLLMKQGDYQGAGQCYLAAGEYNLADRAFLRSAGPAAAATGREVVQQRDAARALLTQVKSAFHSSH